MPPMTRMQQLERVNALNAGLYKLAAEDLTMAAEQRLAVQIELEQIEQQLPADWRRWLSNLDQIEYHAMQKDVSGRQRAEIQAAYHGERMHVAALARQSPEYQQTLNTFRDQVNAVAAHYDAQSYGSQAPLRHPGLRHDFSILKDNWDNLGVALNYPEVVLQRAEAFTAAHRQFVKDLPAMAAPASLQDDRVVTELEFVYHYGALRHLSETAVGPHNVDSAISAARHAVRLYVEEEKLSPGFRLIDPRASEQKQAASDHWGYDEAEIAPG